MKRNSFYVNLKDGRTGERFVQKHIGEIVSLDIIKVEDTHQRKIEGQDCILTVADMDSSDSNLLKNVEIKTVRNFLARTNDNEDIHGTLCFELWKTDTRASHGWLPKIMHPESHRNAITPDILVFLLIDYVDAFASIAFEDTSALFLRLRSLAAEQGIDLDNLPYKSDFQT